MYKHVFASAQYIISHVCLYIHCIYMYMYIYAYTCAAKNAPSVPYL